MKGSGHPLDEYDSVCRDYQHCLRCAKIDSDAVEPNSCDPTDKEYKATFGSMGQQDLTGHCKSINADDDCGTHMCTCTIDLIDRFIQLLWREIQMQPVYKHENGFDAVSTCHLGVATTAAPTTTDYYYYNAYDETGAAPGAAEYFEADGDGAGLFIEPFKDEVEHQVGGGVGGSKTSFSSLKPEENPISSEFVTKRPVPQSQATTAAQNRVVTTLPTPVHECCGFYPKRAPIHVTATHKCCAKSQKSYNTLKHDCCESGQLVDVGSCV